MVTINLCNIYSTCTETLSGKRKNSLLVPLNCDIAIRITLYDIIHVTYYLPKLYSPALKASPLAPTNLWKVYSNYTETSQRSIWKVAARSASLSRCPSYFLRKIFVKHWS